MFCNERNGKCLALLCFLLSFPISLSQAQNPIVRDQFSADPSARVFNGKMYVFPSHDIKAPEGKGLRPDWFCMEDYHVYSSENLTDWTNHGMIMSQYDAPWVDSTSYSMWAPDCIERDGKYYFYFPANTNTVNEFGRKGFGIGVAVADAPEGPYKAEPEPINGIHGIDPNILIDKDGQAYIYWSLGHIYGAKLKDNMLELDSEPVILADMPQKGMKEGPWVFERNGLYYMTLPHVENETERLEYGIGENPLGPFEMKGVIMDESPTGCWTNHHSIVEYQDQWYLFYHHNDYSPDFDKNRSVRIDSLFFKSDGSIQKVEPTLRGVGLSKAFEPIEIDRYSAISEKGASIAFMDSTDTFSGWKTLLNDKEAWVRYNRVDFEEKSLKKLKALVRSEDGGTIQVRLNSPQGPLLAETKVNPTQDWQVIEGKVEDLQTDTCDLVIVLKDGALVEIDWIQFE